MFRSELLQGATKTSVFDSRASTEGGQRNVDAKQCLYFSEVARATMRKTGFKGGVYTNRSFGMDAGLDWMSPREEMMKTGGGATWLRKDSFATYQNTSNTFPVANFRPNWPWIARWRVETAERSKSNVGSLYNLSLIHI